MTGQALTFDNVRPARLTLDDLLGGRVAVWVVEGGCDLPAALRAAPALAETEGPSAA